MDNRGIQRARTKIPGARKVWSTHKSTTTGEVKGAISVLANIAPAVLAVKRKFRVQESNVQRSTWWFVLRADENTLRRLEDSWNTLALPRRWRLKPLFTFMDDGTEMSTSQATYPPSHSDDSNGHSSPDNTPCLPANQTMLQEQDIHTSSTQTGTQLVYDKNEHQTSPHSPSLASSNTYPTPPSTQYFFGEETLVVT